jgi:hypothetical protein
VTHLTHSSHAQSANASNKSFTGEQDDEKRKNGKMKKIEGGNSAAFF